MPDRVDRAALIEAAVGVMQREGGSTGGWHGWRCEYPERYGPCDCNREVSAEILDEVLPLIAKAIEEWRRDSHAQSIAMGAAGMHSAASIAAGHANAARLIAALVRSFGGEQ